MNPLKQLEACGQSPWLDYLKRSLIAKGELRNLIERDGLKGVTSNPSIFEKAIAESDEYADALKQFQSGGDHSISAIYEHLAIADIQAAADVLRPVYDQTQGRDGYISLECSPYLANDTKATIGEATRLWAAVNRPNLMVKVPATSAGIPAIRDLIGRGININITLLFSVDVYEQVVEAYIGGLEDLARGGGDVAKVGSVASFFVSRIDTAVDKRLDKLDDKAVAARLRGKVAIANAKQAYTRYKKLFSGKRWQKLAAAGAKTQRLLWASTSTKDPSYKDTLYVEALIGRDTVDTIPPATMDAFRDHGKAVPDAIEQDVDGARAILAELERHGISLQEITAELISEGVQQFADAFDKLFGAIARRRRALAEGASPRFAIRLGSRDLQTAFDNEMEAWRKGRLHPALVGGGQNPVDRDGRRQMGWLAADRRGRAGRYRPPSTLCRQRSRSAASLTSSCWVWAARAWARKSLPPLLGGSRVGPGFTCSTAPTPRRSERSSKLSTSGTRCSSFPPNPAARSNPTFSWTIFSTASAPCAARTKPANTLLP